MSNKFKNVISGFISCIIAYLSGVSNTDSWIIINNTPRKDVNVIVETLILFVMTFVFCRVLIALFND